MKKEMPALTQPPASEVAASPVSYGPGDDSPRRDAASGRGGPDTGSDEAARPGGASSPPDGDDLANDGMGHGALPSDGGSGKGDGPGDGEEKLPPAGRRPGSALALALSVLALVAVALIGWQVYQLRAGVAEARQELAQRLASGDGSISEARALIRQQQDSIAAIQGKIGALESQLAVSEGQAAALEALYQEFSRSRGDQALAEVERAVNVAAQQLQLAGNVEAALIALQGAEARLALPEQGHLQALRKALIKDIDELKVHPQVDVSGLALRLEVLLERVDGLPLAYEVGLAEAAEVRGKAASGGFFGEAGALEFLKGLGADIWNEVRSLVRLERLDASDAVLLSPAQNTYLRENVKIRLLTARLALLARDGRTYAADLAQARGWIVRFFDMRDEQVQRVVADLAELERIPVKIDQPSLSESFAALRLLQARPSGRPGAGGGDPGVPAPAGGTR